MKRTILLALALTVAISMTACDKHRNKVRPQPNSGSRSVTDTPPPDTNPIPDPGLDPTEKKKKDEVIDPSPVKNNRIPPPPTQNPEYAIKAEGKPGYVQSPYDAQHRLIDVRGLPPGTEAECPYTRRTFLVPP